MVQTPPDDQMYPTIPVPGPPRWRRILRWVLGGTAIFLLALVGVFVWGYFQPKPPGFAPTDPDEQAFSTAEWTRYTVDATDRDEWVFFDLGLGRTVEATLTTRGWDLAFKRTDLLTNSGITNPVGEGGAFDLGEVLLEQAVVPESAGYRTDELGGEDGDEPGNPAISDWYNYSFFTHTVHAKDNTYLVRADESRDALVQFDSYYCDDENAGCITFRYRLVPRVETP